MASLVMKVVEHPTLSGVAYSVPEGDVDRWVEQGWKASDATPASAREDTSDAAVVETVAQTEGIGYRPVPGQSGAAPKPGPAPEPVPSPQPVPEPAADDPDDDE